MKFNSLLMQQMVDLNRQYSREMKENKQNIKERTQTVSKPHKRTDNRVRPKAAGV